jgi:hypothetical protein
MVVEKLKFKEKPLPKLAPETMTKREVVRINSIAPDILQPLVNAQPYG